MPKKIDKNLNIEKDIPLTEHLDVLTSKSAYYIKYVIVSKMDGLL